MVLIKLFMSLLHLRTTNVELVEKSICPNCFDVVFTFIVLFVGVSDLF